MQAEILRGRFWTLSAWESEKALMTFVHQKAPPSSGPTVPATENDFHREGGVCNEPSRTKGRSYLIRPGHGSSVLRTRAKVYICAFKGKAAWRVIMATELIPVPKSDIAEPTLDSEQTTCCVVGGGPGGMMLGLLLARRGVPVTVLEAHKDFDREFRGDTIHPSVLEILDEIGLAEPLHKLRHVKIYGPTLRASNTNFNPIDLRRLKTKFPYIMLIPQTKFLEFIAKEAGKYPEFRLKMTANVESLIEENGSVRGVRYLGSEGRHEVRAALTVGADGRFSKVRHLIGFDPIKTSPPMDILWFRLPHLAEEPQEDSGRVRGGFANGRMLAVFDRFDYWQVGYVFPKGTYQEVRAAGLPALRDSIVAIEPQFAKHVASLRDWHQFSLLSVESSRCPRWYKPGLLLIGDAAHVMSPVGGVGINYAIQDATVAANLLASPLSSGTVQVRDLARVQSRREWPTRLIQAVQSAVQKRAGNPLAGSGSVQDTRNKRYPGPAHCVWHLPCPRCEIANRAALPGKYPYG
jgi:2-polyprenyl-6-methoxyphenol hydroxylase-like FAD-dependent oxidoreductase